MANLAGVLELRFGEVAALRVADIEPVEGGELQVRRTLTEAGGRPEFDPSVRIPATSLSAGR